MNRAGFTLVETLIAMAIIASVTAMAFPKVKDSVLKEAARGARRAVTTEVTRARAAAATRGCPSVLHFQGGSDSRVWVTSCATNGAAVDTIGSVESLSQRYQVSMATSVDSIVFAPTGLAVADSWADLTFTRADFDTDLRISPVGTPVW